MFKFIAILSLAAAVVAKPGLLSTHSVVAPAVIGATVHSAPSAISHQSHTQYHSKTVVSPVLAPVVKTYVAAPVVHAAPIVSHVHQPLSVLKTVHAAPLVHVSAPVLHAAPVAYGLHH